MYQSGFRTNHSTDFCLAQLIDFVLTFFFSIWVFLLQPFMNHRTGREQGGHLTHRYQFHSLDRHLDINRAITAESSPLLIGSSQTQTV